MKRTWGNPMSEPHHHQPARPHSSGCPSRRCRGVTLCISQPQSLTHVKRFQYMHKNLLFHLNVYYSICICCTSTDYRTAGPTSAQVLIMSRHRESLYGCRPSAGVISPATILSKSVSGAARLVTLSRTGEGQRAVETAATFISDVAQLLASKSRMES